MKYRHLPLLLAALITFTGAVADGAGTDLPFHPGERLTFRVRWAFFPAGEAVLEILPQETVNGIRAYHFSMSSKTYEFIDLFYKVGEVLYDTYLVIPDLEHVGGVFEKSREAKVRIWVTADERRIPVRFESEVIVGSFIAELIAFETKKADQGS